MGRNGQEWAGMGRNGQEWTGMDRNGQELACRNGQESTGIDRQEWSSSNGQAGSNERMNERNDRNEWNLKSPQ